MFFVFLLFMIFFALAGMFVVWLGNKVINAIRKDNEKTNRKLTNKRRMDE